MSVQDDKLAGQNGDQQVTEKPEPDHDAKRRAADIMKAYEDRPTLVLPGSGGMVSGTAVNDWLDEDGNPKFEEGHEEDYEAKKEQIEADKALNEELKKAAAAENKGEERKSSR
jgi:hypothetical protein